MALGAATGDEAIPLLANRPQMNDSSTAYVCRHLVCITPVTDAGELAAQSGGE